VKAIAEKYTVAKNTYPCTQRTANVTRNDDGGIKDYTTNIQQNINKSNQRKTNTRKPGRNMLHVWTTHNARQP
jgi:hypothetical protein